MLSIAVQISGFCPETPLGSIQTYCAEPIGTLLLDRRVNRTHRKLVAALRGLMLQQPWEAITVALICQKADVSRSSYYTHFAGKQELLELSLHELTKELVREDSVRSLNATASFAFLPGFIDHVRSHRNIYLENRFDKSVLVIMKNIRAVALGLAEKEIRSSKFAHVADHEAFLFVAGGAYALIEQWIDGGCREPSDTLVTRLDLYIARGLGL